MDKEMIDWQPIETAPKMVPVLVFDPREPFDEAVTIATLYNGGWSKKFGGKRLQPTHWQSKPVPPQRLR